jgi:hypothetical protein
VLEDVRVFRTNTFVLVSAPMLLYFTDNTSNRLDNLALSAGEKMRQILVNGAEESGGHYSYVTIRMEGRVKMISMGGGMWGG